MTKKTPALFTPEQVQRARQRLANEESARQAVQDILQMAQQWAQFGDEFLRETIPPPQVPRAFNISFSGCPVCGRETFKYGNYGFETPLEKPWKVICPNCKSEFPSNDFGAFLKSGMKNRSLLTGDYPDDGWGWKKPGEEKKYWFVAYYCHWHWLRHIIPAVHNLARAYLLTGDRRYAHKALVMLFQIADYYPDMDHNKQSRYATEFAPSYTGKIVNAIWETGVATNLAEAVDFVWDAIEDDKALQQSQGKDASAIKQHLYRNLLMEFVKAFKEYRISGNYGMHQKTLLTTAIVSQDPELLDWSVDYLLNNSGDRYTHEGLHFALTNLFFREGMGHESAPGYHFLWNQEVARICDYLPKAGVNLFGHPTVKRLFTYPFEVSMAGRFTPTIGDSGSVETSRIDLPAWMAEIAYREYQDPLFYPLLPKPQGTQPLRTTFATVIEASRSTPSIRGVRLLSTSPADPDAVAIEVSYPDGHDVIWLSLNPQKSFSLPDGSICRAAFAVMRFDPDGVLQRAFVSGGEVAVNGLKLLAPDLTGTVQEVIPNKHEVRVRLQEDVREQDLRYRFIQFRAEAHRADREIFDARREGKGWRFWLGDYEFLQGKALVDEVDESQRKVRTPTVLALDAVAPVEGMTVSNEAGTAWWRLKSAVRGEIVLEGGPPLAPLKQDTDGDGRPIALIWDFGVGDAVFIPGQAEYAR